MILGNTVSGNMVSGNTVSGNTVSGNTVSNSARKSIPESYTSSELSRACLTPAYVCGDMYEDEMSGDLLLQQLLLLGLNLTISSSCLGNCVDRDSSLRMQLNIILAIRFS